MSLRSEVKLYIEKALSPSSEKVLIIDGHNLVEDIGAEAELHDKSYRLLSYESDFDFRLSYEPIRGQRTRLVVWTQKQNLGGILDVVAEFEKIELTPVELLEFLSGKDWNDVLNQELGGEEFWKIKDKLIEMRRDFKEYMSPEESYKLLVAAILDFDIVGDLAYQYKYLSENLDKIDSLTERRRAYLEQFLLSETFKGLLKNPEYFSTFVWVLYGLSRARALSDTNVKLVLGKQILELFKDTNRTALISLASQVATGYPDLAKSQLMAIVLEDENELNRLLEEKDDVVFPRVLEHKIAQAIQGLVDGKLSIESAGVFTETCKRHLFSDDYRDRINVLSALLEIENNARLLHNVDKATVLEHYVKHYSRILRLVEDIKDYGEVSPEIFSKLLNRMEALDAKMNSVFAQFLKEDYTEVIKGKGSALSVASFVDFFRDKKALASNRYFFVVYIDSLRWDLWSRFKERLLDDFEVEEHYAFSTLPSTTAYSKRALFSGEIPIFSKSEDEKQFAKEVGFSSVVYLRDAEARDIKESLGDSMLAIFSFRHIDELMHKNTILAKPQDEIISELLYITQEIFQVAKQLDALVFLISDHGFIRLDREKVVRIDEKVGSVEYNRYILLTADFDEPNFWIASPRDLMVGDISRNMAFAIGNLQAVQIKQGASPADFSHGGISLQEIVVPIAVLRVRKGFVEKEPAIKLEKEDCTEGKKSVVVLRISNPNPLPIKLKQIELDFAVTNPDETIEPEQSNDFRVSFDLEEGLYGKQPVTVLCRYELRGKRKETKREFVLTVRENKEIVRNVFDEILRR